MRTPTTITARYKTPCAHCTKDAISQPIISENGKWVHASCYDDYRAFNLLQRGNAPIVKKATKKSKPEDTQLSL